MFGNESSLNRKRLESRWRGLLQNVHLVFENSVEDILSKKGCQQAQGGLPGPDSLTSGWRLLHGGCVRTKATPSQFQMMTSVTCRCVDLHIRNTRNLVPLMHNDSVTAPPTSDLGTRPLWEPGQVVLPVFLPVFLPVVLPVVLPVILPVILPVVLPVVLPVILPVVLPVVLPVGLPVILPVVLPVVLSVILPVILPVVLSVILPVFLPVVLSVILPVVLPLHLPVVLPVILPVVLLVIPPVVLSVVLLINAISENTETLRLGPHVPAEYVGPGSERRPEVCERSCEELGNMVQELSGLHVLVNQLSENLKRVVGVLLGTAGGHRARAGPPPARLHGSLHSPAWRCLTLHIKTTVHRGG
ncbi:hypothetical protein P7K49_009087 [Saguinus oedipus]|uniref:Uncharacterized protein n=1 Tax=Saguinus oedipus TaxID=9490 RepID=A0ABQ9VZL6_SAGOE|nr:hypothetical protein P7K49_009087 [Saguinus oedipus]